VDLLYWRFEQSDSFIAVYSHRERERERESVCVFCDFFLLASSSWWWWVLLLLVLVVWRFYVAAGFLKLQRCGIAADFGWEQDQEESRIRGVVTKWGCVGCCGML